MTMTDMVGIGIPLVSFILTGTSTRAGRSPTFQDPGTPLDGLAGTRVPASPIEQVLSFKISPCLS